MTNEALALSFRRSLEKSLLTTHKLTYDSSCAADLLLQRMNTVLRATVDSNFGASCGDLFDALYKSIDGSQQSVARSCEDMPLLFFARSFAVVIEEASRQLQLLRQPNTVIHEAMSHSIRCTLEKSLLMTHKLTTDPQSAAELILQQMNDVLRAAVASNFGAACLDVINTLYESIDREEPGMTSRCEDMPLLFFARSFAVVLEEAVRQLQKLQQPDTTSCAPHASIETSKLGEMPKFEEVVVKKEETERTLATLAAAASAVELLQTDADPISQSASYTYPDEDSMRCGTPTAEMLITENEENDEATASNSESSRGKNRIVRNEEKAVKEEKKEEETERKVSVPAAAATAVVVSAAPATAARSVQQQHRPAAPVALRPTLGNKCILHPTKNYKMYDFSPEAIRGRIIISDIPRCVSEEEIRWALRPFGPVLDFGCSQTKRGKMAFIKLESNDAAIAAVKALDRTNFGGGTVHVKRAEFWSRFHDDEPQRDRSASDDLPAPRFGCYKEPPPAAVAAVDCAAEATVDSDDEKEEEMGDNKSDSSFFSVD